MKKELTKKISVLVLFFFILSIYSVTAQAKNKTDELWEKTLAIVSSNKELIPENIHFKQEELGMEQFRYQYESWSKILLTDTGEIKEELIDFKENGKSIYETPSENRKRYLNDRFSPFKQDENVSLSIKPTNRTKAIDNRTCYIYSYIKKIKTEKDLLTYSGFIYVEEKTGVPLQVEFKYKWAKANSGKNQSVIKYQFNLEDKSLFYVEWVEEVNLKALLFLKYQVNSKWEFTK